MLVRHVLYQLSYDSILVVFYHSKIAKSNISFVAVDRYFCFFPQKTATKTIKTVEIFFEKCYNSYVRPTSGVFGAAKSASNVGPINNLIHHKLSGCGAVWYAIAAFPNAFELR